MKEQNFCLRWNDFRTNFITEFENLREEENFIDVTLVCSGKLIKAHKVVLSACSQFFKYILKENPCKHPIIVMQEISYNHLKSLIDFMYIGETNIAEDDLPSFLAVADDLKIRGLMDASHQCKGGYGEITQQLDIVEGSDYSNNNYKNIKPQNGRNCWDTERQFKEQNNVSSEMTAGSAFLKPIRSSSSLVKNNVAMEYSSDEDIKPDLALLEIDTADTQVSHSSTKSKTDDKLPLNAESKNDNTESHRHNSLAVTSDVVRNHSLEPRPCPSCGRKYSNMSNLRQHIRLIHKPESTTCPLCSKLFKNKLYLKRHLISFHELPTPAIAELEKTKWNVASVQEFERSGKICQKLAASCNNNNGGLPYDTRSMPGNEISSVGNMFNYSSNFIVSSSIMRSVSEIKCQDNSPSVFHGDYLSLTPLQPESIQVAKLTDNDQSLNNLSFHVPDKQFDNILCS